MQPQRLPSGNLLVPMRAEDGDVVGHGMIEVEPGSALYKRYTDEMTSKDLKEVDDDDGT